jgi:hypothetical protein
MIPADEWSPKRRMSPFWYAEGRRILTTQARLLLASTGWCPTWSQRPQPTATEPFSLHLRERIQLARGTNIEDIVRGDGVTSFYRSPVRTVDKMKSHHLTKWISRPRRSLGSVRDPKGDSRLKSAHRWSDLARHSFPVCAFRPPSHPRIRLPPYGFAVSGSDAARRYSVCCATFQSGSVCRCAN